MDLCTTIDLFSGYGGFELGLRLSGVETETACYVENGKYQQEVIQARIKDGSLDNAPIWDDITTFDGRPWRGHIDLVTAGFPCQPHSTAGKGLGEKDPRNLWPDTLRVIREVESRYVLLENVRGLANGSNPFAAEVIGGLSEAGYDSIWGLFSASGAGAWHKRERWFCLAFYDPECHGFNETQEPESTGLRVTDSETRKAESQQSKGSGSSDGGVEVLGKTSTCETPAGYWKAEPGLGRMADGVADQVDRLKAIGNGIVPALVREFLRPVS